MYLYVKQKYNKRNKELHEDAWSYGVVTPSLSYTHIYSDGAIYWSNPNFIKSHVYYAYALTHTISSHEFSFFIFLLCASVCNNFFPFLF